MDNSERQAILDTEHLRLLRLGYFITAATTACFALAGFFYVFLGLLLVMTLGASDFTFEAAATEDQFMGWLFVAMGVGIFLGGVAVAILKVLTAIALGHRRQRMLCLITAGVTTMAIPYGTALGVLTIMVLTRPSVQRLFEASRPSALPQASPLAPQAPAS